MQSVQNSNISEKHAVILIHDLNPLILKAYFLFKIEFSHLHSSAKARPVKLGNISCEIVFFTELIKPTSQIKSKGFFISYSYFASNCVACLFGETLFSNPFPSLFKK